MNEKKFNAEKAKMWVRIVMPIAALLFIITFIFAPIKLYNVAIKREAQAKGQSVERVVDFDLFSWLK